MRKLQRLSALLSEIEDVSNTIVKNAIPLLSSLTREDSDIVEELLERYPSMKRVEALSVLQEVSLKLISDGETVRREIGNFVVPTDTGFEINTTDCPFLLEVWNGDVYDRTELDGLECLRDELTQQLKDVTDDGLVEKASKSIDGGRGSTSNE